jgi:hypothetical protein
MPEYVLDREHFDTLYNMGEVEVPGSSWSISHLCKLGGWIGDLVFVRHDTLPAYGDVFTYWKFLPEHHGAPKVTLTQVDKVVTIEWKVRP